MSSRQIGSQYGVGAYRTDDDRRREEARNATLQSQLDELRQALRELASRQVRLEEAIKSSESGHAQNRLLIEQSKQESQQSLQARAIDENRTRQYMAELELRIDDSLRPIRSLQAHVAELLETSRREEDDAGLNQRRHEETRASLEQLHAVGERNMVVNSQLREIIDTLKNELEVVRRDNLRSEDGVKIVDQEVRRRAADAAQMHDETTIRIDELRSDLVHTGDLIDDLKRSLAHVNPALTELTNIDTDTRQELTRFNEQALQRHETLESRIDELRQSAEAQIVEARQASETRYERLTERLDEVFETNSESGSRLSGLAHQLEELRLADESIRRDIWLLHESRVRLRLEQAQQELEQVTGQRRQSQPVNTLPLAETPGTRPADR